MNTLALCLLLSIAAPAEPKPVDYLRDVKPLLTKRCYVCHGALHQKANLRLDTGTLMRKGGDSGEAVVPGNAGDSLLFLVATGDAGFQMPPDGEGEPLNAAELAILRRWIDDGAKSPADERAEPDPREFWSYRPMRRPDVPTPTHTGRIRNPVDAFLQVERERLGLASRPQAPPTVLLRRLYFDVIGLPPTPDQLRAFLDDPSDAAYAKVVDDLLSRPQYGERWGRHWMDVWRYSDWYGSRGGNEIRYSQRHIWRWRDWIIESLNEDKGYDQMVVEMLAGDELAPADPNVLRATGFLGRNWYKFDRNVWLYDTVEKTSQALLGLTMRCCRCHDHKYDPISQEEYYRFRAFFEPHDVRTDPLAYGVGTEKDSNKEVLKDGLARVFDKQLDAPTYLFVRGDDRRADKSKPLTPSVPRALGGEPLSIKPIPLPAEAYYPQLRDGLAEGLLKEAADEITRQDDAIAKSLTGIQAAKDKLARFEAERDAAKSGSTVFLADDFSKERKQTWTALSGTWRYEGGKLFQDQVGSFCTTVTAENHPRDFRVRLKYRALKAGTYRSIGFSFDYVDQGNSQDVYTSTNDQSQSVQAFHRLGGKQAYPQEGIVKTPLQVGQEVTLEAEARGAQLRLWVNGEHKLDYVMPVERRDGRFALWVHQGAAEFLDLSIEELRVDAAGLQQAIQETENKLHREKQRKIVLEAEAKSLRARLAAERAVYGFTKTDDANNDKLKRAAARAERMVAVATAQTEVLKAEQQLAGVRRLLQANATPKEGAQSPAGKTSLVTAEKKLAAAREQLTKAEATAAKPDMTYTRLGEPYPSTSTGRRLALARWIVSPTNPRAARVAVNHIWMRHFNTPLAPTVENLGLSGGEPSHPSLLDWLAMELVDNGWSMKHLHRLILTSDAYRMSSTPGMRKQRSVDPENRYLWRMNSRRMEAEVVRDAILFVSGSLDSRQGGPEIPENQGQTVWRRSLYFRLTPNEKMQFLELFDVADPNSCYRRKVSVAPQQALAMSNSGLALGQARKLAALLTSNLGAEDDSDARLSFVRNAYERILSRSPTSQELVLCERFLVEQAKLLSNQKLTAFAAGGKVRPPAKEPHLRARENLVHVLFSHNDFVTIR